MRLARSRVSLPICALALALPLAACKNIDVPKVPGVTPYRIVIQQGNYISQEMVEQLKPGMTREQVRFVLGTPLVSDIFHADRWDYVYFLEMPNGRREQRNLAVIFQEGKLARVVGDLMPPEAAKPTASAFPSQVPKEPAKPAAAAKPAVPEAKPPVETAKPAETGPSWRTQSDAPSAPPPAAATEEKKEEKSDERGFFGRLIYRLKPGEKAPQMPEVPTKPEAVPESQPAQEASRDQKPTEEGRGFFGRLIDRIRPGDSAPARPEPAPEPQAQPEPPKPAPVQDTAKEEKPSGEGEKGFFGRLREKIGL